MSLKQQEGNITQQRTMRLCLRNYRNSCFINSSIQLLYSIRDVRNLFTTGLIGSPAEHPVTGELGRLFREAGQVVNSACRLRYLVAQSTGDFRFNQGSEEDSSEFLTTLLGVLQAELSNYPIASQLLNNFWGREKTDRKFTCRDGFCQTCGHLPPAEEQNFQFLKLAVPQQETVELSQLLVSYQSPTSSATMR